MESLESAYYIPHYAATAKICFTNTPPRTYMRAPGIVQCCFAMECVIERIAAELGLPLIAVQELNFIKDGKKTLKGRGSGRTINNMREHVYSSMLS